MCDDKVIDHYFDDELQKSSCMYVWVNMTYSCIQEDMFAVQFQWEHNVNDGFLFYILHVMKAYRGSSGIAPLVLKPWH
jgi:hypothetical protein